jgi:hypothetical protein
MNYATRPFILLLISGLFSWFVATPAAFAAAELSYVFTQTGYADGATVSGAFSGVDLDGNGILVHFPIGGGGGPPIQVLELTSWSMHFSGLRKFTFAGVRPVAKRAVRIRVRDWHSLSGG